MCVSFSGSDPSRHGAAEGTEQSVSAPGDGLLSLQCSAGVVGREPGTGAAARGLPGVIWLVCRFWNMGSVGAGAAALSGLGPACLPLHIWGAWAWPLGTEGMSLP